MKHKINIDSWARKEHYEFFNWMDDPFTGVVVNIDCTKAFHVAKEAQLSFWLYYMHKSLIAANKTEEFRYRIEEDEVVCYNRIHAGTTVDNVDKTFTFAFLNYYEDFPSFVREAMPLINESKSASGLRFDGDQKRNDCIHYTTLPWVRFTSLKHACNTGTRGSCPKISFGRFFEENNKFLLPVSVEVNHALMDGRQIGQFIDLFESLMNE